LPEQAATDSEPKSRIPLVEGLKLEGDMALLHEGLESEADDLSWSDAMEVQLLLYFSSKPGLAENFSLPTVICRQTGCEAQAIGYGPGSLENWQQQTSDMSSQPWAAQFNEVRTTTSALAPDVRAIVVILLRASPDSTLRSVEPASATS
jgi:hypothetical protein